MTSPPPQIDIVTVVTALAALVFSQELAEMIGPYTVIVVGSILGGAIATGRRDVPGFWPGAGFLLAMVTLALLCTVPLSLFISQYIGADHRWLLGPVAVLIAGIGPDWPKLGIWAVDQARGVIERWAASRGAKP